MGRTRVKNMEQVCLEYASGIKSVRDLAKDKKVSVGNMHELLARRGIKKNEHAVSALKNFDNAFADLQAIADSELSEHLKEGVIDTIFEELKRRNPVFAKSTQGIFIKLYSKASQMIELSENPGDLLTIAKIMEVANNTMGFFTKEANNSQSINIFNQNNNINNTSKTLKEKITLNLNIVDSKKEQKKINNEAIEVKEANEL